MKTEGYAVRRYDGPVKRYCQILEIENNPELIRLYRECHSEAKHWKEIRDGIREVGILEMELYIVDNRVVMIVGHRHGASGRSAPSGRMGGICIAVPGMFARGDF